MKNEEFCVKNNESCILKERGIVYLMHFAGERQRLAAQPAGRPFPVFAVSCLLRISIDMAAFSIENGTYSAAFSIEIRSTSRMFFNKEDSSIENEDSSLENEMVCDRAAHIRASLLRT